MDRKLEIGSASAVLSSDSAASVPVMTDGPVELHIPLTAAEITEVEDIAGRVGASVAHVGLYAVWKLMDTIWDGDVTPLLPPSRFYTAEESGLPPADKQAPRFVVTMGREHYNQLVQRARDNRTSPAMLGQTAVRQMLVQARAGNLPVEAAG